MGHVQEDESAAGASTFRPCSVDPLDKGIGLEGFNP